MVKMKKQAKILKVMEELLGQNGQTTTLEVKNECRKRWPKKGWYQGQVSDVMANSGFRFLDNGVHRTYIANANVFGVIPAPTPPAVITPLGFGGVALAHAVAPPTLQKVTIPSEKISRTEMVKKMEDSKGLFYTVTFIKNNGDERVLNCKSSKKDFMNRQGYIKTKDCKNRVKLVNPRSLKELRIGGKVFVVK